MIRRLSWGVALLLLGAQVQAAGPRAWGKSGTATTTNATVTVGAATPFYPASLCVKNTGSQILYINWVTGVAAAVDDDTNLLIEPAAGYCFNFANPNVMNIMTIGLLSASATTTYNIIATGTR